ncbi:MAG: ADP-heptose--LPS heptosyltransferase [Ignavibacteria bacterium CG2_30_36_16]|nr:MAG: ADP-heptose--LPS heptosyltransferase [Ignavibacteria bacterium CG2_30_36_16]
MKILILALSGIGDALMFTPAITLLRKHLPGARIDALVMFKGVKEMYDRNENLNNVYHFDFMKEGAVSSLRYIFSIRHNYDASINVYPSNRKEYNIISFLIGAKQRAGAGYLRKDRINLGMLNNVRITEDDSAHNVETNIRLTGKLINKELNEKPDLYFPLSDDDELTAQKLLASYKIRDDDFVVGFHPGCATLKNHFKRRWEPEKFAELGRRLINEQNAKILMFGGPEEKELKENIAGQINHSSVAVINTANLAQTTAVIKRCDLFITNDSSLMHIASAMKRKVIAIIGPTNPHYIHPWNTEHEIVTLNLDCAPCFIYSPRPLICFRDDIKFKCIKELSVEMVMQAVDRLKS